jgi:predicted RNA-binding protein
MEEKGAEKDNVLYVLSSTLKALQSKDVILMKELSNRTVHSASIYQDVNSIAVAVIVYALSKITERPKYEEYNGWGGFYNSVIKNLEKSIADLQKDDIESFSKDLADIRQLIFNLSGKLRIYINDVFRKAMVNKASRIYEHGISMQRTADILGITPFELAEYAGGTGIPDVALSVTMTIKKRINLARSIFS